MMMKGSASSDCRLVLFISLVLVFTAAAFESASFAAKSREGDQKSRLHEIQSAKEGDFSKLTGMETEVCNKEDDECMDRRMVAEAHLDYIYTQKLHHH